MARRSRTALILALSLAGCGRLGFATARDADADPDADSMDGPATAAHDEDGDGIDDAVDPCPHIFSDASDADQDGVGDLCDPNPQSGTEKWIGFYPMTAGTNPLVGEPGFPFAQEGDDVRYTRDLNESFDMAVPPAVSLRIEVGFEIVSLVGTGQHVISSGITTSGAEYYFVELDNNGGASAARIVQYDTTNGYVTLSSMPIADYHTGLGHLRYDAVVGSSPHYTAELGWDGELYTPNSATPAYTPTTDLRIVLGGMDVRVRYIAIIQSGT
ncbi:MAG TPA: hypothetical protein VGM90_27995 [Kofleriaceae bacterium]|jgi:hypothetical protein